MTFLDGSTNSQSNVTALPYEAFVVGNGSNALISHFSIATDKLDLTPLLAGVSPSAFYTNPTNYVGVGNSIAQSDNSWNTKLTIHNGPSSGSATVTLNTGTKITNVSNLFQALIVPPQ